MEWKKLNKFTLSSINTLLHAEFSAQNLIVELSFAAMKYNEISEKRRRRRKNEQQCNEHIIMKVRGQSNLEEEKKNLILYALNYSLKQNTQEHSDVATKTLRLGTYFSRFECAHAHTLSNKTLFLLFVN